jgi:hypothetical protein
MTMTASTFYSWLYRLFDTVTGKCSITMWYTSRNLNRKKRNSKHCAVEIRCFRLQKNVCKKHSTSNDWTMIQRVFTNNHKSLEILNSISVLDHEWIRLEFPFQSTPHLVTRPRLPSCNRRPLKYLLFCTKFLFIRIYPGFP